MKHFPPKLHKGGLCNLNGVLDNLLMLTWISLTNLFIVFLLPIDQQEKRSKLLNKESGGLLTNAANQLWSSFEDIQCGKITVANFNLLRKHQENLFKIIKIMSERDNRKITFNEQSALQLMNLREKEILHFQRTLCSLGDFVDACQHFPGKNVKRIVLKT